MLISTLLIATPEAHACDWLDHDEPNPCADHDHRAAPPPPVVVHPSDRDDRDDRNDRAKRDDDGELRLRYGMQFLPEAPAHHVYARYVGDKDAYVGAELRYMPHNDLLWAGRVGAGFDVLGGGGVDLTLGLFVGSAGEWDASQGRAVLYAAPIAGTEIGFGVDLGRVFGKYRWLGGIGGGPIDDLLTENELTVGFELFENVQIFGQYLVLDPGERETSNGLGLGVQAAL